MLNPPKKFMNKRQGYQSLFLILNKSDLTATKVNIGSLYSANWYESQKYLIYIVLCMSIMQWPIIEAQST